MPGTAAGAALDAEFLFLLSLLRPLYAGLSAEHGENARAWLERLCWVPAKGDAARSDRNEYLCRLYMAMQKSTLDGIFLECPPEGPLAPASKVFPAVDPTAWLDTVVDNGGGSAGDDDGVDERTYLASHHLPDGRGAFGYLAVSMAKGEPHFIPPSPEWSPTDPQATSTPHGSHQTSSMGASLKGILESRPSPEQRRKLLEFYDSLMSDVEQAERDPERPNPDLEKLITSYQDSSADADVSTSRRRLLAQLRSRLKTRRDRLARRSELLDSLSAQVEDLDLHDEGQEQQDEDCVRNIRPENVALLEAAYPHELVRRLLDGIVSERVAALERTRARRYCLNHVNGVEEDAAEDMEHYRDSTLSWVKTLSRTADSESSEAKGVEGNAREVVRVAERCAELAAKAALIMRELHTARVQGFQRLEELRRAQERVRADIEMLRVERAERERAERRLGLGLGRL